jgi:hypothetical protein
MNHYNSVWDSAELSFEMADDLTFDPVLTIVVQTPDGRLRFMEVPEMFGATLVLRRVHMQDARANAIGAANLKVLARTVMERMELDGLVVEGAVRTTGANPGRRPRVLRFSRSFRSAASAGADRP